MLIKNQNIKNVLLSFKLKSLGSYRQQLETGKRNYQNMEIHRIATQILHNTTHNKQTTEYVGTFI